MNDLTPEEQIVRHYMAAIDSVKLINAGQPEDMTDEEWADTVERNKEHLRIMLAKDMFAGYDIQPLIDASA